LVSRPPHGYLSCEQPPQPQGNAFHQQVHDHVRSGRWPTAQQVRHQSSCTPCASPPAVPPRVAHVLRRVCAAPCARLPACAPVETAGRWRVGVARREVPPRRQRLRGRERGSWRPSRAPAVAAVVWQASPERFSRVSVVSRAAPLRGQRHQGGRCRRRRSATSTLIAVRSHAGRPAAPPVPPRKSFPVAVPWQSVDSRAEHMMNECQYDTSESTCRTSDVI